MTLYLDNNATTPVDPRVLEVVEHVLEFQYGNAASPHKFGEQAKDLVHRARDQIGQVVGARRHEVVFTSGATESNNIAILGLAEYGRTSRRQHIVSTAIEHKSILEPLDALRDRGFEITLVSPNSGGRIDASTVLQAVRDDTLLITVMQVNNETGVCQPIEELGDRLAEHHAFFHVDAAQGFGKQIAPLRHQRINLISISGHKIHAPQGIGALIARRSAGHLPPLSPLCYGGGQELGLRPGTLPVALIAAFGKAAELALAEHELCRDHCQRLRERLRPVLASIGATFHGDQDHTLPHVVNCSFPRLAADEVIEALREIASVSDGSACTSICATASHVLSAMGVAEPQLSGAIRFSWSHITDLAAFEAAIPRIVTKLDAARLQGHV